MKLNVTEVCTYFNDLHNNAYIRLMFVANEQVFFGHCKQRRRWVDIETSDFWVLEWKDLPHQFCRLPIVHQDPGTADTQNKLPFVRDQASVFVARGIIIHFKSMCDSGNFLKVI